jgi:glutathione S-transferase
MPDITLHQLMPTHGMDSSSPFCTKVHRALSYKGLDYTPREVNSPGELKALNPGRSKLPVLEYSGQLILDSTRILRFLDKKHPDPPLYPAGASERARVDLLEDWADESLYWYVVYQRWQIERNFKALVDDLFARLPRALRWAVPPVVRRKVLSQLKGQGTGLLTEEEMFEQFKGHLAMVETLLADAPYLTGEAITAADLALFGLVQAMNSPGLPEAREQLATAPLLTAWFQRVDQETRGPHTCPPAG